jgi:hypothetical protein
LLSGYKQISLVKGNCVKFARGKAKSHMQYDNQQERDPSNQGNPFDPFDPLRQATGERADEAIDNVANRIPGGQQYADQARQASGQGLDSLQQQAQQGMGNVGGIGELGLGNEPIQAQPGQQGLRELGLGNEPIQGQPGQQGLRELGLGNEPIQGQPGQQGLRELGLGDEPVQRQRANASNDPNNPYGNVDDVVADYGNRQAEQGQQDQPNW